MYKLRLSISGGQVTRKGPTLLNHAVKSKGLLKWNIIVTTMITILI